MYSSPTPASCAVCGKARHPGETFCSGCQTSFAWRCYFCGGPFIVGARFCGSCGRALSPNAPEPDAGVPAGAPPQTPGFGPPPPPTLTPPPAFASGATRGSAPKLPKIAKPRATGIDWLLALLMLLGVMGLLITQVLVWICASDPTISLGAFDGVIKAWPTALADPTTTPLMMAAILGLEMCAVIIPLRMIDWFWQHKGGRGAWAAYLAAAFGLSLGAFWVGGLAFAALTVWLWFIIGGLFALIAWRNPRGAGAAITRFWSRHRLPGVRSGASGSRAAIALAFYLAVVPAGMGFLGATTADLAANMPSEVTISGYASLAMPLTDATIEVSALGSDGQSGASLASAVTDKNGYYSLSLWRSPGTALLLRSSGGSYLDEISHQSIIAGPNESLSAIASAAIAATDAASSPTSDQPTSLAPLTSLTPLSTFATGRAQALIGAGDPLDDSIRVSYGAVARQYGLTNLTDVYPEIADFALNQQIEAPLFESRQLGLILAGLDQEAATLGVSEFALTEAIVADLSDGDLDGRNGSSPILINGIVPLPVDATTAQLQAGIKAVATPSFNLTGLPAPQLPSQVSAPIGLLRGLGGLGVYIWSPSLWAFIDGQAGVSAIQTGGGSGQVTCVLADGELPAHFWLSAEDCQIHYDGVPVLASGHAWTSALFTVKASDRSSPPQSTTASFQISVIVGLPTIRVKKNPDPQCPPAGQSCDVWVADASGGVPLYTFFASPSSGGHYPLGMFMKTIDSGSTMKPTTFGHLEGDQGWMYDLSVAPTLSATRAGQYSFEVCAVDSDGFAACDEATLIVPPAPTPPPAPADGNPAPAGGSWDGTYTLTPTKPGTNVDDFCTGGLGVDVASIEQGFSSIVVSNNQVDIGNISIDSSGHAKYSQSDSTGSESETFSFTRDTTGAHVALTAILNSGGYSNGVNVIGGQCTFDFTGTRN